MNFTTFMSTVILRTVIQWRIYETGNYVTVWDGKFVFNNSFLFITKLKFFILIYNFKMYFQRNPSCAGYSF